MRFSFFPAYFDRPENVHFAEQEPDEKIELLLRRHWVTNIPWILGTLFAFALPALIKATDDSFNLEFIAQIPSELLLGALIVWYLLILGYVLEQFLYWYYNIYIVTSRHLIDVNFHSLLYREVVEASLDNVEAISAKIAGIFGSLFNFGDVTVETAAEQRLILFEDVPNPDAVADRIEDLRTGLKGGKGV